jgi:hypothetical protein
MVNKWFPKLKAAVIDHNKAIELLKAFQAILSEKGLKNNQQNNLPKGLARDNTTVY